MNDIAIRVEKLSKRYRIGRARQRHDTLRDALMATFQRSNVRTFQRSDDDFIWALRDVSFEVKRGERRLRLPRIWSRRFCWRTRARPERSEGCWRWAM